MRIHSLRIFVSLAVAWSNVIGRERWSPTETRIRFQGRRVFPSLVEERSTRVHARKAGGPQQMVRHDNGKRVSGCRRW